MKLRSCSESEINGQGPPIGSDAVAELLNRLETLEKGGCAGFGREYSEFNAGHDLSRYNQKDV